MATVLLCREGGIWIDSELKRMQARLAVTLNDDKYAKLMALRCVPANNTHAKDACFALHH